MFDKPKTVTRPAGDVLVPVDHAWDDQRGQAETEAWR